MKIIVGVYNSETVKSRIRNIVQRSRVAPVIWTVSRKESTVCLDRDQPQGMKLYLYGQMKPGLFLGFDLYESGLRFSSISFKETNILGALIRARQKVSIAINSPEEVTVLIGSLASHGYLRSGQGMDINAETWLPAAFREATSFVEAVRKAAIDYCAPRFSDFKVPIMVIHDMCRPAWQETLLGRVLSGVDLS